MRTQETLWRGTNMVDAWRVPPLPCCREQEVGAIAHLRDFTISRLPTELMQATSDEPGLKLAAHGSSGDPLWSPSTSVDKLRAGNDGGVDTVGSGLHAIGRHRARPLREDIVGLTLRGETSLRRATTTVVKLHAVSGKLGYILRTIGDPLRHLFRLNHG